MTNRTSHNTQTYWPPSMTVQPVWAYLCPAVTASAPSGSSSSVVMRAAFTPHASRKMSQHREGTFFLTPQMRVVMKTLSISIEKHGLIFPSILKQYDYEQPWFKDNGLNISSQNSILEDHYRSWFACLMFCSSLCILNTLLNLLRRNKTQRKMLAVCFPQAVNKPSRS